MGRVRRVDVGGMVYHGWNRANFRSRLFIAGAHYQDFLTLVEESLNSVPMGENGVRYLFRENGQVFSGRQGLLRMVFFHPNCATAFGTQGSEPYGLLRLLKSKGYLKDKRT